jgi:hypothetical protein
MIKDGRQYLALVKFQNDEQDWMIVHWGVAAGLSDPHGIPGWVSNQFKLRNPEFLEFFEFNDIINLARKGTK